MTAWLPKAVTEACPFFGRFLRYLQILPKDIERLGVLAFACFLMVKERIRAMTRIEQYF